ncbi:kinase domain-containing protein [Aspergillus piperis CBS 112811]|uniref:non-specific serine/threonine protein kinase n=1 Tax=Aspergillus piperis CBS 112811 TaxID=1448313 RepID=A0A8G1QZW8_9EURO|nr:kinase domain-containing protein [Aspergillus piperis CBS 112811]RAH55947.1 kinase domain-containing protein [Aspergillus piperis CBS 112811]
MAKRLAQSLRAWSALGRKSRTSFHGTGLELPPEPKTEEEKVPGFKPSAYFPVKPGYIFNDRYEALTKLGWGVSSTVWLVRDLQQWKWLPERYLTQKIGTCNYAEGHESHELNMEKCIRDANPNHLGHSILRTFIDSFEEKSPNGTHICLAYEPLREPLTLLQGRFINETFPLDIFKAYMKFLLLGLDYLHSECKIIHTDIKAANILITIEDPSVLHSFAQSQPSKPMSQKTIGDYTIYLCHNNFGRPKSLDFLPVLSDFGSAQFQLDNVTNTWPIQPDCYRAPEVLLGAGWSYSADIWNLGVMMWELIEDKILFSNARDSNLRGTPAAHLAQMIAFLGPPPQELIAREKEGLNRTFGIGLRNPDGKLCNSPAEWFDGPFFDENGEFLHKHLIPENQTLEDTVTCLKGTEKDEFLAFARNILHWLPEDRKTAKELAEDPYLSEITITVKER